MIFLEIRINLLKINRFYGKFTQPVGDRVSLKTEDQVRLYSPNLNFGEYGVFLPLRVSF